MYYYNISITAVSGVLISTTGFSSSLVKVGSEEEHHHHGSVPSLKWSSPPVFALIGENQHYCGTLSPLVSNRQWK